MKFLLFLTIILLELLACRTPNPFATKEPPIIIEEFQETKTKTTSYKKDFHKVVEVTIPIANEYGSVNLKADVYRPHKKITPKTVVILVPGSGNVSRRGEISSNGIDSYKEPIEIYRLWAKALADQGIFVLSYDKRTCSETINPLCLTNPQNDIEEQGLMALANDLDQVFKFTLDHLKVLKAPFRVVLMSTTQGASTISLSKNLNTLSGVVLFSPIIGDLESIWINGLLKAIEKAQNASQKYQLQNRKESMAGFFHSLKNGEFPDAANVKGTTVKFWRSWMESSTHALSIYEKAQIPVLLMFGQNDVFTHQPLGKTLTNISIKNFNKVDRNFVVNHEIPQVITDDVVKYINALPATNTIFP